MWRKFNITIVFLSLFLAGNVFTMSGLCQEMVPLSNMPGTDTITQKLLDDIRNRLASGQAPEAEKMTYQILSSSGYIKPLAEIFYKLAQNDQIATKVVKFYGRIIENWPDSAWAQKAVVEVVPLLLMSGGQLGNDLVPAIWKQQAKLLASAPDAMEIGEDPELLRNEVQMNLLYLANSRSDIERIKSLTAGALSNSRHNEELELAKTLAFMSSNQKNEAIQSLQTWFNHYPASDLMPSAYYTLYSLLDDQNVRLTVLKNIQKNYGDSLEAYLLIDALKQANLIQDSTIMLGGTN